jgi:transposase, IS30 family
MKQKQNTTIKSKKPLSLKERSVIELRWCRDNQSASQIATELDRNKSTISRELAGKPRQGRGRYDAERAHAKAMARIAKRGNVPKLKKNERLKAYVETKLKLGWSPEQISIRLPLDYQDDETMRISYEAVYQEVYRRVHRGGNGTVKRGETDLRPHLPRRHTRRAKKGFRKVRRAERALSLPSIEIRPTTVDERVRVGDFEDDTLVSRQSNVRVKSVNDRKSGVALFRKTKDGTAQACDQALTEALSIVPECFRFTLTRDRGTENLSWSTVQQNLNFTEGVFFAHPYCSHERGANENANGLLRRFFPKKTDWDRVSREELAQAEYLINTRPRKRFDGKTPVEVFYEETGVALYS